MSSSLLLKDLPKEAPVAPQPDESHNHSHSSSHSHSHSSHSSHSHSHHPLIHGVASSDSSDSSDDDTPPSHPPPPPQSDDEAHTFDISQTPFAGLYTHITSSIPLITSLCLRFLFVTNCVAVILGLFQVLSPSDDSSCAVSLLTTGGGVSYPRVLLSLFFDSTYASAFTSVFALYELGSRVETQLGSTFFLLTATATTALITAAYTVLMTALPAVRLYACSCGVWPLVLPLLVIETWWNRRLPRSFPLIPYPISPLLFPLLLTLVQQVVFGVHPYPLFALGAAYVVAVPVVLLALWAAPVVERALGRWMASSPRFVSREKAGKILPWAPLVIKYVRTSTQHQHNTAEAMHTPMQRRQEER